jgi:L-threonylcarbamoyladenylate synthase
MKAVDFATSEQVSAALAVANEVVAQGGVLLLPTESYYGLGADPMNAAGVGRVCELKERSPKLGLPVLCADWEQLQRLVRVPDRFRVKLSRLWPAALTVVLSTEADTLAAKEGTLAVRIPAHDALRALLYRTGPLTGTSANQHGLPPCTEAAKALRSLVGVPDLVLDAGPTPGGEPSTLIDLTGAEPRLLRPGAGRWEDPALHP